MIHARHLGLGAILGVPAIIAALSLIGLVAALIGDGVWDAAGWFGLLAPVVATVWAVLYRRHR